MKEFLEFLRESVNSAMDRLRFPFFNSFIISWFIFNWKPLLIVMFSEEQLEARIAHVSFHYSELSNILYYPLLSATLYTILTPMLKYFVAYLLTDINKENRDAKYDFVIDSYSKKNILAAKQYEYQLSKEGAKKVEELSTEIETLKAEKEKLQNEKIQADQTIQEKIQEIETLTNNITIEKNIWNESARENEKYIHKITEEKELIEKKYSEAEEQVKELQLTILDYQSNHNQLIDTLESLSREVRKYEKGLKGSYNSNLKIQDVTDFRKKELNDKYLQLHQTVIKAESLLNQLRNQSPTP